MSGDVWAEIYSKENMEKYVPTLLDEMTQLQLLVAQLPPHTPICRTAGSGHAESKKFQQQEQYFTERERE